MNILTDALPLSVEVGGVEYPVNVDFRAALRSIMAFEDADLTADEKQIVMLYNLYGEDVPTDINGAMEQAAWFLNCGDKPQEKDSGPRLFSFSKDARFIFAAFKQTHGIDLDSASLHWWKFLALFMDLGSETAFCQLTALRKRIKSGKATKEEKSAARDMGDLFDLDEAQDMTLEEREALAHFERLTGIR